MLGGLALVAAALVTATVIWRGTDSAPTDSGDTLPHRSELS